MKSCSFSLGIWQGSYAGSGKVATPVTGSLAVAGVPIATRGRGCLGSQNADGGVGVARGRGRGVGVGVGVLVGVGVGVWVAVGVGVIVGVSVGGTLVAVGDMPGRAPMVPLVPLPGNTIGPSESGVPGAIWKSRKFSGLTGMSL